MLAGGNYADYCVQKANEMENQHGRYVWYFVKTNFDANPRAEMLNLLGSDVQLQLDLFDFNCTECVVLLSGYNAEDLETKYAKFKKASEDSLDRLSSSMTQLGHVSLVDRLWIFSW